MNVPGRVNSVKGKTADISIARRTDCGSCRACGLWGSGLKRVMVENTLAAQKGEYVMLELQEKTVSGAALIVYAIPLLLLGAGLLTGFLLQIGEIYSLIMGSGFLAVGVLLTRFIDRSLKKNPRYLPKMLEKLSDGAEKYFIKPEGCERAVYGGDENSNNPNKSES